jgi:uncharacterized protein HemX
MAHGKSQKHKSEAGSHEHKIETSLPEHKAETNPHHEHKAEGGGLLTGRLMLGLLVALSLGFGAVMAKKYRDLEAKAVTGAASKAVAPAKDPEVEKALNELGKKLGSIKSELDELEPVLKKLGVKVEKKTAAGPHGH